jgi:hypothetical protein
MFWLDEAESPLARAVGTSNDTGGVAFAANRESASVRLNALPVCLFENPNRLVSLWDVVNVVNVPGIMGELKVLSSYRGQFALYSKFGKGNTRVPDEQFNALVESLRILRGLCIGSGFERSVQAIDLALLNCGNAAHQDLSSVGTTIDHVCNSILLDGTSLRFLHVSPDRVGYVDNSSLFGNAVETAFPSASRDIREAGNCLAAECTTGCVFHAMRAAEISLRALATDRQVSYPDASVSLKQVGDLLTALDGKMVAMRSADAKNWPSRDIKDAQIRFYHTAIAEFRDFNEAWRKHMAHAHDGAFYDRFHALSILNHVQMCMTTLAQKITEVNTTPLYWRSA